MAERDASKTKLVRDFVNRPPDRPRAANFEARRRLWEALCAFVTGEGGWVTSLPGVIHLRVEVPQGSALPAKLIELGYSVRHAGAGTRIGTTTETIADRRTGEPVIKHHGGIFPVDVIEITMGG